MRVRAIIAIVLLLAPVGLSAQRLPGTRLGGRGPLRPTDLPPQPPSVAREMQYKRLRVAFETYPLVSNFKALDFAGAGFITSWTSFGMGTRADYRLTRHASATLDMTSSFLGGPAFTETAELGTRLHPERGDGRVYPFVDVRFGYMHAYDTFIRPVEGNFTFPPNQDIIVGGRYTHGVGGVGGAGLEYALTRRFSVTTAASVMRSHMTAYRFSGSPTATSAGYLMTSVRYTIGLRYNPVRMVMPQPPAIGGG